MQFLSSYYWQQGAERLSLVLQQLVYPKGHVSVLFGCICKGKKDRSEENKYFAEGLASWFRVHRKELVAYVKRGRGEHIFQMLSADLQRRITELDSEVDAYRRRLGIAEGTFTDVQVILCVKEYLLLLNRGTGVIRFFNSKFGHAHSEALPNLFVGVMEPGIGVLLATEGFVEKVTLRELEDTVTIKKMRRSEQATKELDNLGKEAELRGGSCMGALLLVTREG